MRIPAGFLSPGQVLARLRLRCPDLGNGDLTKWRRTKALLDGRDYRALSTPGSKKDFFVYRASSLPRIRRVYHYDKVRHFSPELYKSSADLSNHSLFYIFLQRHPLLVTRRALHLSAIEVFKELHEESDGIFVVRQAASVFGGELNCVAVCECVDEVDLSLQLTELTARLRRHETTLTLHWQQARKDMHYVATERKGDAGMKAIIVMSAMSDMPAQRLGDLFEKAKGLENVQAASVVYGDAEIILTIEAKDPVELSEVVVDKLRVLPGVTGTRTYIVVEGYDYPGNNSAGS